ncbi:MAG: SoxXA-binding protein [bacterium]
MRKFLVPGIVAAMLVFTSACATSSESGGKMNAKAAEAISAAAAAQKKAASVGGEWRDIGKMIKKAKALAKEGKTDKAIKLAEKAKMQGELGYEQIVSQKNVGLRTN